MVAGATMGVLILLWGLLAGRGVWCLTGPGEVSVRSRSALTVQCRYDDGFEDYIKYWCKGENSRQCLVTVKTTTTNKVVYDGRFLIKDTPAIRSFTVTMVDTRPSDADSYYCGIERNLKDNMHMVTVEVLPGVCHMTTPWTDIVDFPSNSTEIEAERVVVVPCQKRYKEKNITLQCREESGGFVLSPQSDGDYCLGVCSDASMWTDMVDFPENFTEIAVNGSVVVSCQPRYGEKKITLLCREESGGFVLSPQGDGDDCVGVCRNASSWTDMVDFPENFTEIAVNGSVVVSCQPRYGEKKITLQCREESGGFVLSPQGDGDDCVGNKMSGLNNLASSLLTSTIGFVVPFLLKLVVLLMILVGKTSWMINRRLRTYRKGLSLRKSVEARSMVALQKSLQHKKQEQRDMSPQRAEVLDIYENLKEKVYTYRAGNKEPTTPS